MGDFDALAWRAVWAGLIELSESNCNRLFHRRDPVLIYAVMQGDESIVRLLLEYGADANAQTATRYEYPEYDALATLWAVLIFQPNA